MRIRKVFVQYEEENGQTKEEDFRASLQAD